MKPKACNKYDRAVWACSACGRYCYGPGHTKGYGNTDEECGRADYPTDSCVNCDATKEDHSGTK